MVLVLSTGSAIRFKFKNDPENKLSKFFDDKLNECKEGKQSKYFQAILKI